MLYKHFIALLSLSAFTESATLNPTCKCVCALLQSGYASATNHTWQIPSDPCWPSSQAWSTLNDTLYGRVLPLNLPTDVCPNGGEASQTYMVNATETKHVQIALQFANEHNLKVNVNNTGHASPATQRYFVRLVFSACSSLTCVLQECILWCYVVSHCAFIISRAESLPYQYPHALYERFRISQGIYPPILSQECNSHGRNSRSWRTGRWRLPSYC